MENCTAWKSGTARKSSLDLVTNQAKAKGGWKGKIDRECFRCERIGDTRADCRAQTHINGGSQNLRPKGKVLEIAKTKKPRPHKRCHLETIDLVSFEVLSDHGDEMDGDDT